jgi:penicillin-binding protein-related factor A (putative recombinase)
MTVCVSTTHKKEGKNDGTGFQQRFQDCLVQLQEQEQLYWHRFTDTKAARNFVRAQPGDYMAVASGKAYLFELKSTSSGTTLSKFLSSKEGRHQLAEARKWNRAGGSAWFVREDKILDEIHFYCAAAVADGVFAPTHRVKSGNLKSMIETMVTLKW